DRDDRLVVELGVVEAVQQMARSGPGRGDADADLAGELRVAARHERGHLLVARLDELGVAACAVERAEKRVDPVAGVAVDAPYAPFAQPLEDVVGDEFSHRSSLLLEVAIPVPRRMGRKPALAPIRAATCGQNGPMSARAEVVVVTGASAGVGRAVAHAFAKRGAQVGLLARDRRKLDATQREVESLGGRAIAVPTDVADFEQVEAAAEAVEAQLGPIDVWVNDAMATI